jgi:hypothetical protein
MDQRGLAPALRPIVKELTSRLGSTEIPELLDRLEVPFDPDSTTKRQDRRKPPRRSTCCWRPT